MWSVQKERAQAQDYAMRALMLEELGQREIAKIFHKLVMLCDEKIELFKRLETGGAALTRICNKGNLDDVLPVSASMGMPRSSF
jgi:hypothetical protein